MVAHRRYGSLDPGPRQGVGGALPLPQPSVAEQAFAALEPELEAFGGTLVQRVLVDV